MTFLHYFHIFRALCHENKFALLKVLTSKGQSQILEIIFQKNQSFVQKSRQTARHLYFVKILTLLSPT